MQLLRFKAKNKVLTGCDIFKRCQVPGGTLASWRAPANLPTSVGLGNVSSWLAFSGTSLTFF